MTENKYKMALVHRLRFPVRNCDTETLFTLSNDSLREIYNALSVKLRELPESDPFGENENSERRFVELKLKVVKDVISDRIRMREVSQESVKLKQRAEQLLTIAEENRNRQLRDKSPEELEAEARELLEQAEELRQG